MKILINILLLSFLVTSVYSQERKVKLAIDGSNSYMKCFTTGRYFNLTTASLGVNVKTSKSNLRFYGTYGFNSYIGLKTDVGYGYADNFAMKSHFLGVTFENYFLDESKKTRLYFGISLLNEVKSNFKNGYISYKFFFPLKLSSPPIPLNYTAIYYGDFPYDEIFGGGLYQSIPILIHVNGGASFRLLENLRLNLSVGYSLSVMNYKYVKWTKYDDRDEMIRKTPMQRKALHSIAGQVGLNYVFSFQKKSKTKIL